MYRYCQICINKLGYVSKGSTHTTEQRRTGKKNLIGLQCDGHVYSVGNHK